METLVQKQAPEFKAEALLGEDFKPISLSDYRGKLLCLFFYPLDFTFVCPTELVDFNEKLAQFNDRDALVFGASTDNEYSHLAWCKSHEGLSKLKYPLLAQTT